MKSVVQGAMCPPKMRREHWRTEDYEFDNVLYKGDYSMVVKARCLQSGSPVVIKLYLKDNLHPVCRQQIQREIAIHSTVSHPNIIDFYGAFEDADFFYLILECAEGGDLFGEMRKRSGLMTEQEAVNIVALPLLRALVHMHSQGYIHRDIKPENILFTGKMVLKLADFGFVVDQNAERPVTRAGTVQYMAPEMVNNPLKSQPGEYKDQLDLVYDEKVDIWSAAVLVYELLHGFPTFGRRDKEQIIKKILATEPQLFPQIRQLSDEAKDFLALCFKKQPEGRSSTAWLIQHTWLQTNSTRHARRVQPQRSMHNLRTNTIMSSSPATIDTPKGNYDASPPWSAESADDLAVMELRLTLHSCNSPPANEPPSTGEPNTNNSLRGGRRKPLRSSHTSGNLHINKDSAEALDDVSEKERDERRGESVVGLWGSPSSGNTDGQETEPSLMERHRPPAILTTPSPPSVKLTSASRRSDDAAVESSPSPTNRCSSSSSRVRYPDGDDASSLKSRSPMATRHFSAPISSGGPSPRMSPCGVSFSKHLLPDESTVVCNDRRCDANCDSGEQYSTDVMPTRRTHCHSHDNILGSPHGRLVRDPQLLSRQSSGSLKEAGRGGVPTSLSPVSTVGDNAARQQQKVGMAMRRSHDDHRPHYLTLGSSQLRQQQPRGGSKSSFELGSHERQQALHSRMAPQRGSRSSFDTVADTRRRSGGVTLEPQPPQPGSSTVARQYRSSHDEPASLRKHYTHSLASPGEGSSSFDLLAAPPSPSALSASTGHSHARLLPTSSLLRNKSLLRKPSLEHTTVGAKEGCLSNGALTSSSLHTSSNLQQAKSMRALCRDRSDSPRVSFDSSTGSYDSVLELPSLAKAAPATTALGPDSTLNHNRSFSYSNESDTRHCVMQRSKSVIK
eukprot:CAMPEP_0177765576 /NCGR_PEP_ID=MMETSP0491_2-20121128/8065_1 /TAXON_ID=63592 /ORGANISM="Tetraselmis chuii, Strain PLY429" /LENGTH=900 /DNA_ID=CAMNT_0019281933 /DNA_START=177 /DNA_END=2879 /DNA_ORIENTATION=+